jgi:hypothetical protein
MDARHAADALLAEFGRTLGIPQLAFDARGACTLMFDGAIAVMIAVEPARESIMLLGHIGAPDSAAAKRMLMGNYLWRDTADATLALDPAGESAVLQARLALDALDSARFSTRMSDFVTGCELWRKRLAESGGESAAGHMRHLPLGGVAV